MLSYQSQHYQMICCFFTVNCPPISAEITGSNKHNILCNVSSEGVRVKNTGSVALMSIIIDMYYVMDAWLNPNEEYQASVWMLHKDICSSNSAAVPRSTFFYMRPLLHYSVHISIKPIKNLTWSFFDSTFFFFLYEQCSSNMCHREAMDSAAISS